MMTGDAVRVVTMTTSDEASCLSVNAVREWFLYTTLIVNSDWLLPSRIVMFLQPLASVEECLRESNALVCSYLVHFKICSYSRAIRTYLDRT